VARTAAANIGAQRRWPQGAPQARHPLARLFQRHGAAERRPLARYRPSPPIYASRGKSFITPTGAVPIGRIVRLCVRSHAVSSSCEVRVMKAGMLVKPVALSFCIAALGGCATHTSPHTFNQSEVGRMQTVEMGTVYALREVTIQNDSRGVARITGTLLGGIAGSTIGGGNRANAAGAVA